MIDRGGRKARVIGKGDDMAGQIKPNVNVPQPDNGAVFDPTSLEAWQEQSTIIVPVGKKLGLKIRVLDVMGLMAGDGETVNPLMSIISKAANNRGNLNQQQLGAEIFKDEKAFGGLVKTLDDILIKVLVSPPLIEQGFEKGISVNQIPFEAKMKVFFALMGGEAPVAQLSQFRGEESGVLAPRPTSEALREEPQPVDGDTASGT